LANRQAVCTGPVAELVAPHAWERLEYGEQLG
jgi:hypothetical protein